jgi:hypothetical protein
MRLDGPGLLLAVVVRLLPAGRRDWGRALRAELDGVVPRGERWAFAVGGATTVVRQFAVLKSLAYTMITVAIVAAAAVWSGSIGDAPLRWPVMGVVLALAGVTSMGRLRGPLGPVRRDKTARLVRGAGFVVVAVAAAGFLSYAPGWDNLEEARAMVPVIGATLVCWLAGLIAVTADRSVAADRTLRWGALSGVAAAVVWLANVFALGRVPFDNGLAIALLAVATASAVIATSGQTAQAWIAALVTGAVGTLLVVIELVVVAGLAPARMIPDLAPAALTRADGLELSRNELQDPFVSVFFIGGLIALALGIVAVSARARRRTAVARAGLSHR